jgi:GNAT superfamily N-acetyltransferase
MDLRFAAATESNAAEIAQLRTAVAECLTRDHGHGHWSSPVSEQSILPDLRASRVLVARHGPRIVAALTLATKKPWAIDLAYFTSVRKPLYLTDMAVATDMQRKGVGRAILDAARVVTRAFPADAIRLDAYDAPAGAGPFYAKCGFREVGRVTYRGVPLVYFEAVL